MSTTSRGLLAIVAGTGIGQLLAALVIPVLSRLYGPEEFGLFSVASAIMITFAVVSTGRLELAIPLPKSERESRALVIGGFAVLLGSVIAATVAAIILADPLSRLVGMPALAGWLPWLPLLSLPLAAFSVLNQWNLRLRRYSATARRNVIQALSMVGIQTGAGAAGAGAGGLVLGFSAGQAIGAASLLPGAKLGSRPGERRPGREEVSAAIRRYRRFPLVLAPAGLLNSLGLYLPVVLVSAFYGPVAAGWFGLTQRVLALPVTLVGQASAQVYSSELARRRREHLGGERRLFWRFSALLAGLALLVCAIVMTAGPALFGFVFGRTWIPSGELARAMAPLLGAQLVASALSLTLIVYERSRAQLLWDLTRLALVVAALVSGHLLGFSLLETIWLYAGAGLLAYLVSWELSRRTVGQGTALEAGPTSPQPSEHDTERSMEDTS